MYQQRFVVRTKLAPPRLPRHTLPRHRITRRLLDAREHRLTLVQAGTGYGKSTALAALGETERPLWYHATVEDADPQVFLRHLFHGFQSVLPGLSETSLALLEAWERQGAGQSWMTIVDRLLSDVAAHLDEPLLVVIDDFHLIQEATDTARILDRLIGSAPARLNHIIASRYPVDLPGLVRWRVRGELLEIQQDEIAFQPDEIATLFSTQYGMLLTAAEALTIHARTEGWPIALPLIWRRLQRAGHGDIAAALGDISGETGDLFAYLVQEVLAQQTPDLQSFLRLTAVLPVLTAASCDHLRQAGDSAQVLRHLRDNGLFVVDLGTGHSRYHHLFRDLLRHQLSPAEALAAHNRAAEGCRARGEFEEAIDHLLAAAACGEEAGLAGAKQAALAAAARLLAQHGRQLVRGGRLDTLGHWLAAFPPDILTSHPPLLTYLGDIARLQSRFDEALGWYQQAEQHARSAGELRFISQALRGQARVYLDTVNPSRADQLLQEALRLSDGLEDRESRARLLDLLAENMLNQGRFKETEQYQAQARQLRQDGPAEAALPLRLLLRTGRLREGRALLETQLAAEKEAPVRRPRAHRETSLLLALILAFQGERAAARRHALDGTARGAALQSHFVTAVGHMRQGHAWLLQKDEAGALEARRCFEEAIRLSETLQVPRLKVEACWGLCQVYGFYGDVESALHVVEEGIAIARDAGDEWIEAGLRLTMGASLLLASDAHSAQAAVVWLEQASTMYHECGDTYGAAVARVWQCLLWQQAGDEPRLLRDLSELLQLVSEHGYDYLFTRRTLLGPPDPRRLVPLLLFARSHGSEKRSAERLLSAMGLQFLTSHPGYQLRIQTLGAFRLWRGSVEVTPGDWRRQKARQLFLLLITRRETMLERDQIIDLLWPELDPEGGVRDFKIAFTTLCKVLEPQRSRSAPYAYVLRDGSRYGLRPEADFWLDAAAFESLLEQGEGLLENDPPAGYDLLQAGLDLYQGEYLREYPYEEWASEARERLQARCLRAADTLAHGRARQQQWQETIRVAQFILARDDCWESAYRLLMEAHYRLGQRVQALRSYQRCAERLRSELGVAPAPATRRLQEQILGDEALPVE